MPVRGFGRRKSPTWYRSRDNIIIGGSTKRKTKALVVPFVT